MYTTSLQSSMYCFAIKELCSWFFKKYIPFIFIGVYTFFELVYTFFSKQVYVCTYQYITVEVPSCEFEYIQKTNRVYVYPKKRVAVSKMVYTCTHIIFDHQQI
jgi:hypothetical protein